MIFLLSAWTYQTRCTERDWAQSPAMSASLLFNGPSSRHSIVNCQTSYCTCYVTVRRRWLEMRWRLCVFSPCRYSSLSEGILGLQRAGEQPWGCCLVSVGPVQGEPAPPAQPWTERKWSRRLFSCATHLKRQYRLGSSAWVKRLQTRLSFDRRSWLEHKWNKWLWKAFYWFSVKLIRQNSFMILGQIKT